MHMWIPTYLIAWSDENVHYRHIHSSHLNTTHMWVYFFLQLCLCLYYHDIVTNHALQIISFSIFHYCSQLSRHTMLFTNVVLYLILHSMGNVKILAASARIHLLLLECHRSQRTVPSFSYVDLRAHSSDVSLFVTPVLLPGLGSEDPVFLSVCCF